MADLLHPDWSFNELINNITSSVDPDFWDEVGGPGSVSEFPGVLVVSQTRDVHEKLETFLQQLRWLNDPTCVDFQQRITSPDFARLERQLDEETSLECVGTPLGEVLAALKNKHRLPNLHVDWSELNDIGYNRQTPVTVSLRGVSLRSGLNALLLDLDLGWYARDNVLVVTSLEKAWSRTETLPYRTGQITDGLDGLNDDWLIDLLTSVCDPESWDYVGGPGSIEAAPGGLVIAQTHRLHDRVRHLLTELRRFRNPDEDFRQPPVGSEGDRKIRMALDQEATIDVSGVPFDDVIEDLSRRYGIRIYIELTLLDDEGLNGGKPISFVAHDRPLGEVLDGLCRVHSGDGRLSWDIVNESVYISFEGWNPSPPFRLHRLSEGISEDRAAELIMSLISPKSWEEYGGPGVARDIPGGVVVGHNRHIQRRVNRLLQRMRHTVDTNASISPALVKSEKRRKLERTLRQGVAPPPRDQPLEAVLADLAKRHDFEIAYDRDAIKNWGCAVDAFVQIEIQGKMLADLLDELLGVAELDWVIRDDRVWVVPRIYFLDRSTTEFYETTSLPDSLASNEAAVGVDPRQASWEEEFVEMVAPDRTRPLLLATWRDRLLVTETATGHALIRRRLADARTRLREMAQDLQGRESPERLIYLGKSLDSDEPVERATASIALHGLAPRLAGDLAAVLPLTGHKDAGVRRAAVYVVSASQADKEFPNQDVLKQLPERDLLEMSRRAPALFKMDLCRALGVLGRKSADARAELVKWVDSRDEKLCHAACRALGHAGVADPAVVKVLSKKANDFGFFGSQHPAMDALQEMGAQWEQPQ